MYRRAVVDDVQVRALKVDDLATVWRTNVSILNVPFLRYCPVKNLRASGHFMDSNRNNAVDAPKRLANAIAGNASANGVERLDQRINLGTDILWH